MKTLQKTYTGKFAPNPLEFDYWIDLSANSKGSVIKTFNGIGWTEINNNAAAGDSEQTNQRLQAVESTTAKHSTQLSNIQSVKVESGGIINLSGISALELSKIMNELSEVGIKLYLIGDAEGKLPSSETHITVEGFAKLLLFGKTSPFGVSVGDILAVTKYSCKIIPLNDAKPSADGFPGADGLSTVWDKERINKIDGIEWTANHVRDNYLPRNDRFPSRTGWLLNVDDCLNNGLYPTCGTNSIPVGWSNNYFTCSVTRTSTNDGAFDTIEQTAYGRGVDSGWIYKRIIFYKSDGTDTQYGPWVRVNNNSVTELPDNAPLGTVVVQYVNPYAHNAEEVKSYITIGKVYSVSSPTFEKSYDEIWSLIKIFKVLVFNYSDGDGGEIDNDYDFVYNSTSQGAYGDYFLRIYDDYNQIRFYIKFIGGNPTTVGVHTVVTYSQV